jgi:hypothetical protein
MNAIMHDIRLDNPKAQKDYKGYTKISQIAARGLSKLPSYVGPVLYRGDSDYGGLVDTAHVGTTFSTPSFMSTSSSANQADSFGATVGWVVLPSSKSRGKDLKVIAKEPAEKEVLFPPSTRFKVIEVFRAKEGLTKGATESKEVWRRRRWQPDKGTYLNDQWIEMFTQKRDTIIVVKELGK